ncbi:kinase-like domain-containing protein, partial [Mycena epipterygia]
WVAKRFFNIGAGEGVVEIQENYHQVVKEVTHLSKAGYFLKRFIMEANKQAVDITQGIEVTEFKLGIEVVQDTCGPSKASGFSLDQYQLASSAQIESKSNHGIIVRLFEPRRSSTVSHWSGTNEYPPWHRNKLGSTLNTFTHYAYLLSLESTVLADLRSMLRVGFFLMQYTHLFIQAATTIDEDGNGIQVFGVGDHGMTGIDTFLEQHECVDRCKQLRLQRGGFATEPAVEDSDEDDG